MTEKVQILYFIYMCNRLEELEMQKLLEQRKREKAEEKEARQRVRAQIEADKAARRAKAAAESGQSVNTTSAPLSTTSSSTSAHHRKDYTETRLQVLIYDLRMEYVDVFFKQLHFYN